MRRRDPSRIRGAVQMEPWWQLALPPGRARTRREVGGKGRDELSRVSLGAATRGIPRTVEARIPEHAEPQTAVVKDITDPKRGQLHSG